MVKEDEIWMRVALKEARLAFAENEVPVGCVVVKDGNVIGRGHNRVEGLSDPTAHAEILALTAASTTLQNWRLSGTTVYVTVEPCLMCTGALILARPKRVVFGARDEKFGCLGSRYDIIKDNRFNHRFEVTGGVLADEAVALLQEFFKKRREEKD
ncbi:MAG: tRNA adenosine(34) deaminase TadA [candidate division WOR-3 bacterium]